MLGDPKNKEYVDALRDEVKNAGRMDFDTLRSLPLLNAFLDETWRFRSPVPGAFRRALEDIELSDGTIVPKGVQAMWYATSGHYDESVFGKDVDEFNPFRMRDLKQQSPQEVSKSLLMFGGGNRMCLGEHFARLEMRLFLARFAQSYRFEIIEAKENGFPVGMVECKFQTFKL